MTLCPVGVVRTELVSLIIFLVPGIARVPPAQIFLSQAVEILVEAGQLSPERLQGDGPVHHLLPPEHHGLPGDPGVRADPDKVQSFLPLGRLQQFPCRLPVSEHHHHLRLWVRDEGVDDAVVVVVLVMNHQRLRQAQDGLVLLVLQVLHVELYLGVARGPVVGLGVDHRDVVPAELQEKLDHGLDGT